VTRPAQGDLFGAPVGASAPAGRARRAPRALQDGGLELELLEGPQPIEWADRVPAPANAPHGSIAPELLDVQARHAKREPHYSHWSDYEPGHPWYFALGGPRPELCSIEAVRSSHYRAGARGEPLRVVSYDESVREWRVPKRRKQQPAAVARYLAREARDLARAIVAYDRLWREGVGSPLVAESMEHNQKRAWWCWADRMARAYGAITYGRAVRPALERWLRELCTEHGLAFDMAALAAEGGATRPEED